MLGLPSLPGVALVGRGRVEQSPAHRAGTATLSDDAAP